MKTYLIIGNGVAGVNAAEQLRQLDNQADIHIFSDESYPFYARIRLPQIISGERKPEDLLLHSEEWYNQQGITLHLAEKVHSIDPHQKLIKSEKGTYSYHALLLANGSSSFLPPIPGAEQECVFTLRSMQNALEITKCAKNIDSAILIGGGLLGLEAAHGLLRDGVANVNVLELASRLLPRQTDQAASKILQEQLETKGFKFYLGVKTKQILGKDNVAGGVALEDGRKIEGKLILISAGVRSNLQLARDVGLEVNRGVIVDDNLRTSNPDIFAAGDVTEHRGICYGIWPAAQEQGKIAGVNLGGKNDIYQGTVMNNRLSIAGIDLVASGEIDAEGKYESIIKQEGQIYRKLVLDKDKTLIGCLLLGNITGYNQFLKDIQEKKKYNKTFPKGD